MMPNAPVSNRVAELLDAIKTEFDATSQDAAMLKLQRDEYEHKSSPVIVSLIFFSRCSGE
jgi:glucose repression regulatory protein TUP1